jgi:hypothetical protein
MDNSGDSNASAYSVSAMMNKNNDEMHGELQYNN